MLRRTISQLIRLAKVRYSGLFLPVFRKFEHLWRHNFAHFTSSALEKELSDMTYWIVNGQQMTMEEHEEWEKQQRLEEKNVQQEAARLGRQLNLAYAALKDHMERNPKVSYKMTGEHALEQQIYYNLRQNLHRADDAPRCAWIREDGTTCRSPRMRNDIYCYAHCQMKQARAENLWLPALTDANAIQMAVMLVQRALIDDEISEKKAGLLLYSIQIAAANVGKTTFGESDEEMVTETQPENDVMDAHKERMEARKRMEKVKSLPLTNADAVKTGDKTSPLINTDDTDLSGGMGKILPRPVSEPYANQGQTAEVHADLG